MIQTTAEVVMREVINSRTLYDYNLKDKGKIKTFIQPVMLGKSLNF